jgi:hypothetical protein
MTAGEQGGREDTTTEEEVRRCWIPIMLAVTATGLVSSLGTASELDER